MNVVHCLGEEHPRIAVIVLFIPALGNNQMLASPRRGDVQQPQSFRVHERALSRLMFGPSEGMSEQRCFGKAFPLTAYDHISECTVRRTVDTYIDRWFPGAIRIGKKNNGGFQTFDLV